MAVLDAEVSDDAIALLTSVMSVVLTLLDQISLA